MRPIAALTVIAVLGYGLLAVAQDEDDDARENADAAATVQAAEQAGMETFAPSEEVAADTAVAFPTDI